MYTILLIDDEKSIRDNLPLAVPFEAAGFTVAATASHGQEALDKLPAVTPALILLDVCMPVMDGLQFLRRLREGDHAGVRVVMLSGFSDFAYAKEAMKYGVKAYLTKPADEEEFLPLLAELRQELDEEMARVPRLVREQEWECLPSANMACAFNHDDIRLCTRGEYQPTGGTSYYTMGIDLGMHTDPTALVVMDAKTATVVYSEVMPVGQDHKRSAARARQIWDRFGHPEAVVDVTGGATGGKHEHSAYTRIYEEAMPNVRPYTWTRDNKVKMVYNLALVIEKHEINIAPGNAVLLKQLGMYEYDKRPNGTYDYHGPRGSDDDCVAALLMAWEARRRGWYGPARSNLNSLGNIL